MPRPARLSSTPTNVRPFATASLDMPAARTHIESPVIAVVVPCYRERNHVLDVLRRIGPEVGIILVVDDACPEGTGAHVRECCQDSRVRVIVHETNLGVGGATLTGYRQAAELGADIIVKLDGDGQMDPALIPRIVQPILAGRADYAKGNRFHDLAGLSAMPRMRVFGNLVLSFASKVSSGYWHVFDPTNGFTAIHAKVARELPFAKIAQGFFFESDLLFRLYLMDAVVSDVPMRAHYGNETSSLKISAVAGTFAWRHLVNAWKRTVYTYFLRNFTIASIELVLGLAMFLFGAVFGGFEWRISVESGIPATAGTVILAALPIILGVQMLIAFLDFDTRNIPRDPIHPYL